MIKTLIFVAASLIAGSPEEIPNWIKNEVIPPIPQPQSYHQWADRKFTPPEQELGLHGPTRNPDGDSNVNFLEYALAGDPIKVGAVSPRMVTFPAKDTNSFHHLLLFSRPIGVTDLIYEIEYTHELGSPFPEWFVIPEDKFRVNIMNEYEEIVYGRVTSKENTFMRLRVTPKLEENTNEEGDEGS